MHSHILPHSVSGLQTRHPDLFLLSINAAFQNHPSRWHLSSPLRGAAGELWQESPGKASLGQVRISHRLTDVEKEKNCRHTPHSSIPPCEVALSRNISPVPIRLQRLFPHSEVCTECTMSVRRLPQPRDGETDGLSSSGNGCHTVRTPCLPGCCLHPPFSVPPSQQQTLLGTSEYHPCP